MEAIRAMKAASHLPDLLQAIGHAEKVGVCEQALEVQRARVKDIQYANWGAPTDKSAPPAPPPPPPSVAPPPPRKAPPPPAQKKPEVPPQQDQRHHVAVKDHKNHVA